MNSPFSKRIPQIAAYIIGLLVVIVFESVLSALRAYVFSHTTSRIDVELGSKLFRHLVRLPLAATQAQARVTLVGDTAGTTPVLRSLALTSTGTGDAVPSSLLGCGSGADS